MGWEPDFTRIDVEITGRPANSVIYADRLINWREFYKEYGYLPSILVMEDGHVVNGNHRLMVARENYTFVYGLIMRYSKGEWVTDGNLCKVI